MAPAADSLIGSAMPSRPAGRPSITTKTTVWPSRRRSSARSARAPGRLPSSCRSAWLPIATDRPSTWPGRAPAGPRLECVGSRSDVSPCSITGGLRRWPRPGDARSPVRGWRPGGAAPRFVLPGGGHDRHEPGLALGQRAGLVDDQRIHPLEDLECLGVLDQDARSWPRVRSRP